MISKNDIMHKIIAIYLRYLNNSLFHILIIVSLMLSIFIGGAVNLTAIMTNDGRMPVYTKDLYINDSNYFSYDDPNEVKMHIYTDKFRVGNIFFSIGDIIIVSSFIVILFMYASLIISKIVLNKKISELMKLYEEIDKKESIQDLYGGEIYL